MINRKSDHEFNFARFRAHPSFLHAFDGVYSNSTRERNVYFFEMACEYDTSDNEEARERARTCSRTVSDTKTAMNEAAERVGSEVRQIYQSPTCNADDKPFQER